MTQLVPFPAMVQHSDPACWLALRRELFAVTLDPDSGRETRRGFLPVGALVADAARVLVDAVATDAETLDVRVRLRQDGDAVTLERVGTAALRGALRV